MIGLIDTIFAPLFNWLNMLQDYLSKASVPLSQRLPLDSLFSPIALLSPSWAAVVTNVFALAFIYIVILVVSNGAGILERFKNLIKWW